MPRAGAEDAGALDALDLDDMFADDGDMLFEGLDLDLDGMGDLGGPKASPTGDAAAVAMMMPIGAGGAIPSPPKRTGGPNTRRPPPPDEVAAPTTGAKRKTKRKSKSPALWDDESADGAAAPKKKQRRSSKAGAATATAQKGKATTTAGGKKKKGATGTTTLPPSNIPTVAAAGRFGKRGSVVASAATSAKGKTAAGKGGKSKAKRPSSSQAASASGEMPNMALPPKAESSFCGLKPSSTIFYPFMEALPPEPSLKPRKSYPVIDKLFSTFSSALNNSPQGAEAAALDFTKLMKKPIYKLLLSTFEMSEKEKANFTEDKRKALAAAIPKTKEYIAGSVDKPKLVADLFQLIFMMRRQHDFLQLNLKNMERWCKNNFSSADYDATYKDPEPGTEGSTRKSWMNSLNKPLFAVRIVCQGFKPPAAAKDGNKLPVMLPINVLSKKAQNAAAAKAKKRKSDAGGAKASAAAAEKAVTKKVKYADAKPSQRRHRLLEEILNKARQLESTSATSNETKMKELAKRAGDVEKLVQDDSTVPHIHTSLMWKWLETSGYFASDFDPAEIQELLQTVWTPQVDRDVALKQLPKAVKGLQLKVDEEPAPSSKSLFHRLQSLLVEEDESDIESDVDLDSDDDDDSSIESWGFIDRDEDVGKMGDDDDKNHQQPMADLSKLTLEERTFVTLKHVGLIQQPLYPSVQFESSVDEDNGDKEEEKFQESQELPEVIESMAKDLNRLSTLNNSRVAFLQAASQQMNADLKLQKRQDEEGTGLISKCQTLLKKAKESKSKKTKAKKDELNLPW